MDGYLGQVIAFAGNYAPRGWMFCEGQTLEIVDYEALYSVLGIAYGGNGSSTFKLPNLKGRVIKGEGQNPGTLPYQLGQEGGSDEINIEVDNLPSHQHTINSGQATGGDLKVTVGAGNTTDPSDAKSMASAVGFNGILSTSDSVDVIENCVTNAVPSATDATGASQPLYNIQPFQVINYIICVDGQYPPRN